MSQDEEFAAQLASGGQSESELGKAPAPQDAEADGDTTGEQPAADAQTSPEGQADDGIGEGDLLASMDQLFGQTPEKNEEQLRQDYAASSKEARRLNGVVEQLTEALQGQGVEMTMIEGQFGGLRAVAADKGDFPSPPEVDSQLKQLLFDDEEAAVASIWAKAQSAAEAHFARPDATISSVSRPPSREQVQEAEAAVLDAVDNAGNPVFPHAERVRGVVKSTVSKLSPEMREAFNSDPRGMLQLLYGSAEFARARLLESAKLAENNKTNEQYRAAGVAGLSPSGGITSHVGSQGDRSTMANRIAQSAGV